MNVEQNLLAKRRTFDVEILTEHGLFSAELWGLAQVLVPLSTVRRHLGSLGIFTQRLSFCEKLVSWYTTVLRVVCAMT